MSPNEFDTILADASWRRKDLQSSGEVQVASHDEMTIAQLGPDDEPNIILDDILDDDSFTRIDAQDGSLAMAMPVRPMPGPPPEATPRAAALPKPAQPAAQPAGGPELPPPGARIDQYELIRELGRGGMGAVYLARDTKLARRVAIKFLLTSSEDVSQRFFQEAQATAQFNHENIVVIHDYGEYQGHPYMVLEYLQGAPLSDTLQRGQTMPASRAVELMIPVVKALVAAHEYNIVHRDLKPDNIFITDAGAIKVLDFGIAKILQSDDPQAQSVLQAHEDARAAPNSTASALIDRLGESEATGVTGVTGTTGVTGATGRTTELTRRGAIMGTLPYMSPEQWGIDSVDHRTDLWAVGILLFRMLTGRHPLHPLKGSQLVVTAMLDQSMPSIRTVMPDVDSALADVIDRCLIKPKDRRMPSAKELLRALEAIRPGHFGRVTWDADKSPYAGLSAFQEADATRFFGRSREIASAATRLRDQPLLGIVGPSGVGKSSFIRAGVVPALKQSGETWETLVIRPGRQPMAALAHAVAPLLSSGQTSASHTAELSSNHVAADLSEHQAVLRRLYTEPGFLGTVLRSRARRQNRHILLFVDQFEELYTLIPEYNERLAFTSCLAGVADDPTTPLRVVISIRSDFLDRAAEDPHFMGELSQGLFFLTPPNRDGLREALTMPAEMAGFRFETPAMVEDMLGHLENTPGALPLLQFAATKLWEARDARQKLLTEASYRAIGGIMGALASHADSVISELPPGAQRLVRAIFLRLVTPERTRAIVSVGELYELSRDPGEVQRVVDQLVHARLLVVQTGDLGGNDAGAQVEIVHESMIHGWPALRRWLDENQDDAAFLEQLRNAARQWQARGRPQGLLWRGEAMEDAKRWFRRYRGELPDLQKAYLNEVFALARRSVTRKRIVLGAVIVLLSIMVAAAAVALVLIRDAEQQAKDDAARALAAERRALEESERAKQSEAEAKLAFDDLQAEVSAREAAEKEKAAAEVDLRVAYENLQRANQEMEAALAKAKRAKRRASRAKRHALASAEEAMQAQTEAEAARAEAQRLYEKERERYERVLRQTGKRMDVLK